MKWDSWLAVTLKLAHSANISLLYTADRARYVQNTYHSHWAVLNDQDCSGFEHNTDRLAAESARTINPLIKLS